MLQNWLGVPIRKFASDLKTEIIKDEVLNGAATLAFFWMLALFPAMIFLLSLVPFLPIENPHQSILDFIGGFLPQQSAEMFSGIIAEVTEHQSSGLLSFSVIATLWAASSGMVAIMEQLNKTDGVTEGRTFVRERFTAFVMTIVFGIIIIGAFLLIVLGGYLQSYLTEMLGYENILVLFFQVFSWVVMIGLLLSGFSWIYYYGPNLKKEFRIITPGGVIGVLLLIAASLGFQIYVNYFGNYAATYGSLGAAIILMLWLYITGLVILLGAEINGLLAQYHLINRVKIKDLPNEALISKSEEHLTFH